MQIPLTVLGIIDGFGYSPQTEGNAIFQTPTPNLDYLWTNFPHFLLKAAEEEVGLGFGEIGNSEVGHISIGTGRVIPQSLSLINRSIDDGSFFKNPGFLSTIEAVKANNSKLHLLGIISTSGVHGHLFHLLSLIKLAKQQGLNQVYLHLILDGRDCGPRDTPMFLKEIDQVFSQTKIGRYASLCGRALSMDRNNNWERTQKAYDVLFGRSDNVFANPTDAINHFYNQNIDDENMPPCLITPPGENPVSITENDGLIISNFREDRARQITKALSLPQTDKINRPNHPSKLHITTMTSYEQNLPVQVAFPPPPIPNTLSDVLSQNQITQIHIAESEKYAHVTYFFNGGREDKAPLEEYHLAPSLKPEEFETNPAMSAQLVYDSIIKSIDLGYQFIVFNFANCDMVGHTGNFESTKQAVAIVDSYFKGIWEAISQRNGYLYITADHGNSEQMINPKTNAIYKEHTIAPVPFIVAHNQFCENKPSLDKVTTNSSVSGLLSDIAPTILTNLGIPTPPEMTGTSLLNTNSPHPTQ